MYDYFGELKDLPEWNGFLPPISKDVNATLFVIHVYVYAFKHLNRYNHVSLNNHVVIHNPNMVDGSNVNGLK
jgi:hypothetical protein